MLVVNASLIRKELERASSTSLLNFWCDRLKKSPLQRAFVFLRSFGNPTLAKKRVAILPGQRSPERC